MTENNEVRDEAVRALKAFDEQEDWSIVPMADALRALLVAPSPAPTPEGRTVTTVEELDALPLDSVVVDFAGCPRTKRAGNSHMPGGWTHGGNSPLRSTELADGHPMRVIYEGRIR
ncbi:hypothetical protein [Marisediminicola senii]|uniref:hypothetical protein n=1 Tax=Marisediminicola senii TaxID=2711233 RepID=UPI0013EA6169|nr:hypothetical protein [Marisediminicola senii]